MGSYRGYEYSARMSSDESRPLAGRLNLNYGDYYTGKNTRIGLSGNITRIPRFKFEVDYNYNFIDLPEGNFHTNTVGLRLFYFFSTELYFKSYIQLNDDKLSYEGREKVVANFLLRWIYSPGSNFYLVYNDARLLAPGRNEISNRTLMAKATFFWRK